MLITRPHKQIAMKWACLKKYHCFMKVMLHGNVRLFMAALWGYGVSNYSFYHEFHHDEQQQHLLNYPPTQKQMKREISFLFFGPRMIMNDEKKINGWRWLLDYAPEKTPRMLIYLFCTCTHFLRTFLSLWLTDDADNLNSGSSYPAEIVSRILQAWFIRNAIKINIIKTVNPTWL